jgi:hypothetical protein
MGQFFGQEWIPPVVKASSTSLTLATTYLGQPTVIKIGGQAYTPSSTITLNTGTTAGSGVSGIDTGTFTANTLYYVYACVSNNLPILVISTSGPSTGPTGFTSAYKYLAKFRTFVGSAAIADVNSIWVGASQDQSGQQNADLGNVFTTSSIPAFGTITINAQSSQRVGSWWVSHMEITTGNPTASATAINLPSGYTIDVTNRFSSSLDTQVGFAWRHFSTSVAWDSTASYLVFHDASAGNTSLAIAFNTGASQSGLYTAVNGSAAVNASDKMDISFRIPIAEWAGVFTAD